MRSEYQAEVDRLRELVDEHLLSILPNPNDPSAVLHEAMNYTLGLPGKRIRPVLLLLAGRAVGFGLECEKIMMPFACAVEYIHTYSLIHDDLPAMDNDDLRRGMPSNHKVYGEAMAILAGDGLLSAAFELMAASSVLDVLNDEFFEDEDYGYEEDGDEEDGDEEYEVIEAANEDSNNMLEFSFAALSSKVRAMRVVAEACGCYKMVGGQAADIMAGDSAVSAELLDFIHSKKTAALISASLEAGACLAYASDAAAAVLAEYGEKLGLAYQIVDDILDAVGKTEDIGKTAGKDRTAGKLTYPAVHGMEASRAKVKELTEQAVEEIEKINGLGEGADEFYVGLLKEFALDLAERVK